MRALELARDRWPSILQEIAGLPPETFNRKHQPCPLCGGHDRFRYIDKKGDGRWVCNQCRPETGDGMELLQECTGRTFADLAKQIEGAQFQVQQKPKEKDPRPYLREVWAGCKPLLGDNPVTRYLSQRGVCASPALRYHQSLRYYGERNARFPAMVAMVQAEKPVTLHVTYLQGNAKARVEAPKKVLPPVGRVLGASVRLFPAGPALGIAEGIETALACAQSDRIPVWAAVSAEGMKSVIIPGEVKRVVVYADNDASYTGQAAAYELAKRMVRQGREVEVKIPPTVGHDWLDELTRN